MWIYLNISSSLTLVVKSVSQLKKYKKVFFSLTDPTRMYLVHKKSDVIKSPHWIRMIQQGDFIPSSIFFFQVNSTPFSHPQAVSSSYPPGSC